MDRGAWWATVHRVSKRLKRLNTHACNMAFSEVPYFMHLILNAGQVDVSQYFAISKFCNKHICVLVFIFLLRFLFRINSWKQHCGSEGKHVFKIFHRYFYIMIFLFFFFFLRNHNWRVNKSILAWFYSNWSRIALQCCASFYGTTAWISDTCTLFPSFSGLPPTLSRPIPLGHHRDQAELPLLCSSFPLAMHSTPGNAYMSVPLSPFVPPSPFPTVSISPFPMSASLLLPCK